MRAVLLRWLVEVRRRWVAMLALVLLIGAAAGVVLAAAAAARRTESAYPRFLEASRSRDILVSPAGSSLTGFAEDAVRAPGVVDGAVVAGLNVLVVDPPLPEGSAIPGAMVSVDGRAGYELERPNVLAGRLPRRDRATEVLVNHAMARLLDLAPGDTVTADLYRSETESERVALQVVGIGINTSEVVPVTRFDAGPTMLMTPAAFTRWRNATAFDGVLLRVAPGTDAAALERNLREAAQRYPETGGEIFFADDRGRVDVVSRALRSQVLALAAFALVAALTVLLVVGQVLARHTVLHAGDHGVLHALGFTRGQLVAVGLLRVLSVTVAGCALGALVAWLASPLAPIGPARLAEPAPGRALDISLVLGALALVVALCSAALPSILRAARTREPRTFADHTVRISTASRIASRLAPPVAVGVRFGLDSRVGRSAVPVRSAIVGTAAALLAILATTTVGASLQHLLRTPALYGQGWDVLLDAGFAPVPEESIAMVRDHPQVDAVAGGVYGLVVVEGKQVPAIGIDAVKGSAYPTLLEGRPAYGDGEIVLGAETLRGVEGEVGEEVTVEIGGDSRAMSVVGRAVFPHLGIGSFTPTGLGRGAALSARALASPMLSAGQYSFLAVRFRPGAPVGEIRESFLRMCSVDGELFCEAHASQQSPDIGSYEQVRMTPIVLAAFLGVLGVATLSHAMFTAVRRRRREIAILRALGFLRRQVRAAVAVQAVALAGVSLLIAVPLGIAAGRTLWTSFATQVGVAPRAVTSVYTVSLVVALALVVANAAAALPGRSAARTRAADVLRAE